MTATVSVYSVHVSHIVHLTYHFIDCGDTKRVHAVTYDVTSELVFSSTCCCFSTTWSSFLFFFLHDPFVLQSPLHFFFSPLARDCSRFRNFAFQARKSAWMLPLRLFTTLQSPSPRVIIRIPLSIQSHLSTFLPTWKEGTTQKSQLKLILTKLLLEM